MSSDRICQIHCIKYTPFESLKNVNLCNKVLVHFFGQGLAKFRDICIQRKTSKKISVPH